MTCVCTHPESFHRTVSMSVPLVGVGHYMPSGPLQIAATREGATYDRQECDGCGCCSFEADD